MIENIVFSRSHFVRQYAAIETQRRAYFSPHKMKVSIQMIMRLIYSWGKIKSSLDMEQPNQIFGWCIRRKETALKVWLSKAGSVELLHSRDFEQPIKS